MARLYADENFPLPAVEELRRLGHEVKTVQDAGGGEQSWSDLEVLRRAIEEHRAVLTLNRKHFIRLHREHPDHSGIVVCTVDLDYSGQATRIDAALRDAADLEGQLIRVNRPAG